MGREQAMSEIVRSSGRRLSSMSPLARALAGALTLVLPLLCLAIVANALFSPARQRVTLTFLVSVVTAVGLGIYSGNSGILSFGHAAFMGIGAYVAGLATISPVIKGIALPDLPSYIASIHVSLPVALLFTLVAGAIVGYLSGFVVSLLGGPAAAIATLAFLVIVNVVLTAAISITRGPQTFYGLSNKITIWVAWALASAVIVVGRLYRNSVSGLQLRASREDELAARSMGVDVRVRRLGAWVLSASVSTMGGALLGFLLAAFSPKQFYFSLTFAVIVMLVVGGMTTVTGAVGGAAVVALATEVLRHMEDGAVIAGFRLPQLFGLTDVGLSALIIGVLIFRPSGLFGRREPDEVLVARANAPEPSLVAPIGSRSAAARSIHLGGGQTATVRADREERQQATLVVDEITMVFGGLAAVAGVSLSVARGEILGLIGPNGSGKTTLLNVMSGVLRPTRGRVSLDRRDITGWPAHRIAGMGVARTFQNIRLFPRLTVLENVQVGVAGRGRRNVGDLEGQARRILDWLQLSDIATRMAGTLPYGEQRRVEIARALAMEPEFLLLDEPAAGMDEVEAEELDHTLAGIGKEYGMGMIVVEHKLRLVMSLCKRVAVLDEGKLITIDVPEKVQVHPGVVEAYIGRSRPVVAEGRGERS